MPVRTPQNGRTKGSVLFLVLIILSSLSVLGGVLFIQAENRYLLTELESDRIQAIFLAEAAVAKSLHEMKSMIDYDGNGIGNIQKTPFGGGEFFASHISSTNEISASGIFNGVKRTLLIRYALN